MAIAGRYPVHVMQAFDSDKVLGKQGSRSLPWGCSERTSWPAARSFQPPKGQQH